MLRRIEEKWRLDLEIPWMLDLLCCMWGLLRSKQQEGVPKQSFDTPS